MSSTDGIVAELAEHYTLAAKCFLAASLLQHLAENLVALGGDPEGDTVAVDSLARLRKRLEKFPEGGPEIQELLAVTDPESLTRAPDAALDRFNTFLAGHYRRAAANIRPYRVECGRIRLFLGLASPFTLYDHTVGSFHELSYEMAGSMLRMSAGEAAAGGDEEGDDLAAPAPVGDRWEEVALALHGLPRIDMEKVVFAINEEYQTAKSIETRKHAQENPPAGG